MYQIENTGYNFNNLGVGKKKGKKEGNELRRNKIEFIVESTQLVPVQFPHFGGPYFSPPRSLKQTRSFSSSFPSLSLSLSLSLPLPLPPPPKDYAAGRLF